MNTVEILKAARELISDEKRWTQTVYARDENGNSVNATDPMAVCFCSRGAIDKITAGNRAWGGAYDVLLDLLVSEDDNCLGVADFNDKHTHAEVLSLFDRAIARAESEAA
ncbi:hypothetical protein CO670_15380 [Rhizobium sp. J15]|uniref:DUF6197 family protein n=1 Tax=Rhizobium sp. J15 TaxID=2035450 RepID=UPI000BE7EE49|nr:hypothetical protein [Rhizobium sp. J15]PDT15877.1 hypothetical protein CO670_15380 [Rhizobium sp. J15]